MARAAKLDLRAFQRELASRLATKTAAQVEAIVTLAGSQAPTFGTTARHLDTGDGELRRLAGLARSARAVAVNQVIREHLPADAVDR